MDGDQVPRMILVENTGSKHRQVGVFLQGHKACWLTPVSVEDTAYQEALNHSMYIYMDVSLNGGFSPQIIHFNRVFHYFHHPYWGTTILGNTHILYLFTPSCHVVQPCLHLPPQLGGESNDFSLYLAKVA